MDHFWVVHLAGQALHLNTLLMSWLAMGLILILAVATTRQLQLRPTAGQAAVEGVYNFCRSITLSTAGKRGDQFLFFVGSLFLFIVVSNLLGQLPLRLIELPHGELMAATGDINVPAALAVSTLLMYFAVGIKVKGAGYFKHYLSPLPLLMKGQSLPAKLAYAVFFWPFILLNLFEDLTRPGSLMLRLFFNIFVGEILAVIAMKLMPWVLPSLVIFLELFVAVIQAYIFAMLSSVYISLMSESHDDHDETHASTPDTRLTPASAWWAEPAASL